MKKFTFILMILLAYAGFTMAQTIEDFESIKMNVFSAGAVGSISVVPNPDPTGANTSTYVAKMTRGAVGSDPWAGWYSTIPTPINITTNRYLHLKIWKPRASPTGFKVEGGAGDSGDTYPLTDYTNVGHWEELVYDWTTAPGTGNPVVKPSGEYVKIVMLPDFQTPVGLDTDITLYFDDMYVNNDPAVGSAPVQVIEDFEIIPLTRLSDDNVNDATSLTLVANPDPTGINISAHVIDFLRDKDAVDWTGFWSLLPTPADVTTNHYAHVKVWKPRQSDAKFKLEAGTSGTKEFPALHGTTELGKWQDLVFDVTEFTGTYPKIGLLLDLGGVALSEDIHIYVDDIILNNDPNPIAPPSQIFNLDMVGQILPTDSLFITGSFGGIYGTWAEPGTNPNNKLTDPDGDGIYSIELSVPNQVAEFKFFKNKGWDPANPGKDPFGVNRSYAITGNCNILFTWGVGGSEDVTLALRDNKQAGKILMYPNPVRSELTINSTNNISNILITNTLGKVVGKYVYSNNKTINTNNLSRGMYFVTFVNADGTKVTQKLIKE